jgi:hypothetical protein
MTREGFPSISVQPHVILPAPLALRESKGVFSGNSFQDQGDTMLSSFLILSPLPPRGMLKLARISFGPWFSMTGFVKKR